MLWQRRPWLLGVICVGYVDCENTQEDGPPPASDEVTWCCTVFVEVPFSRRLFSKVDTSPGTENPDRELREMLVSEPGITPAEPGSDRRRRS